MIVLSDECTLEETRERANEREKNTYLRYITSTIFPSEARIAASSSSNDCICIDDPKKDNFLFFGN